MMTWQVQDKSGATASKLALDKGNMHLFMAIVSTLTVWLNSQSALNLLLLTAALSSLAI
jgi:hypothetical protein